MLRTYEGVLRGDRIDWTEDRPPLARPVRVHVTVIEEDPPPPGRGERMAAALASLAERGGVALDTADPREWQREVRRDRELPGREE